MLARLIERAQALIADDAVDVDASNDPVGDTLRDQWDRARAQADSPAERAEIDAVFGRHAA